MKKNNYYQITIILLLTLNLSSCFYNKNHLKLNPEKALQALKAIKPNSKSPLDSHDAFINQQPTQAGNQLYLWRQSRANNLELWRSNGHPKGTKRLLNWPLDEETLKNAEVDIPKLQVVNNSHILFWQKIHNPHPKQAKAYLYISDGSINGTKRIHTLEDDDSATVMESILSNYRTSATHPTAITQAHLHSLHPSK